MRHKRPWVATPSCCTPVRSHHHSTLILCRLQLVPSSPGGSCFIEGSFYSAAEGWAGADHGEKETEEGKLIYPQSMAREPRWCPCPRLPKYTFGGEQRQHFADSIWKRHVCGLY